MAASTQTFTNPIIPGFAPDPSIVHVDGVFYLVNSSFHIFPGLPIYKSTDLAEWTLLGHALHRSSQLSLEFSATSHTPLDTGFSMVATGGLFAPTIRHHRGTFYIVCTNAGFAPSGIKLDNFLLSTTDIEAGVWSDPVHFAFRGIDPDIFFDDAADAADGAAAGGARVYIQGAWHWGRREQPTTTIRQFEVDIRTGAALSEVRDLWSGFAQYDTEGPHIYKRGGWYYLLVAEGGTFEHHLLSIARSRSVTGPYEAYEQNPILTADGTKEYVQNTGHGELVQDSQGQWWAVVLGVCDEPAWGLGRETFLATVDWPADGWPSVAHPKATFTRAVTSPKKAASGKMPHSSQPGIVQDKELVFVRNPDMAKYSFDRGGDHVTLYPTSKGLSTQNGTFTFIGKRQRALSGSVETTVYTPSVPVPGVTAGLAVYKDGLRYASISIDFAASKVVFNVTNSSTDLSRTQSHAVAQLPATMDLKVGTTAAEDTFYYRVSKESEWVKAGAYETTELFAREMTGPIFGLFAVTERETGSPDGVVFSGMDIRQQ